MSTLNLTPNPILIVSQAAIFLANMFVIKHYMLTPYLRLKEKRESKTSGSEVEAKRANLESDLQSKKVDETVKKTLHELREESALLKDKAKAEMEDIVSKAKTSAADQIDAYREKIVQNLDKEKLKVPETVKGLVKEVISTITK